MQELINPRDNGLRMLVVEQIKTMTPDEVQIAWVETLSKKDECAYAAELEDVLFRHPGRPATIRNGIKAIYTNLIDAGEHHYILYTHAPRPWTAVSGTDRALAWKRAYLIATLLSE